jgi:hypothetical protein
MMKSKPIPVRLPPKRTLTKQQAVRHLMHCAARMIAAGEDPFAIQLLLQSADKLLIDLAKRRRQKLVFTWDERLKPEYKHAVITTIRETSNFFKHADKDHDVSLHVFDITRMNIIQIGICIVNYHGLYGEWTDHMQLLFSVARIVFPDCFVPADQRSQFNGTLSKIENMTLAEYLSGWWNDPLVKRTLPNLAAEKAQDLRDTVTLYQTRICRLQEE